MVDAAEIDAEEKTVLKLLKSFYKLVIARPDKTIFIEDPAFSVTITTYIEDDRPMVNQYMARILKSLTDSTKNCKLVAGLPDFEQKLAKQIEKPLPPKVIHEYLVIQSRITALKVPKTPQSASRNKTFLKTAGTKQLVYQLLDNDEEKQNTLQERSIPIKGVVSLCFGAAPSNDHHHHSIKTIKCIYRVTEALEPKILERCIFNCGYNNIQRMVRLDDGSTQCFDIYRDEVFAHTAEETKAKDAMPQYLDDNVMIFDPAQTLVPNNHNHQQQSSWFSGVKAYLPSFW